MINVGPNPTEDIVVAISAAAKRIVGFTSPEPDGLVGSIARSTAQFIARSGRTVLFIDLREPVHEIDNDPWTVGDLRARRGLVHAEQGLDWITVLPDPQSRYTFADSSQLRAALDALLKSYQFVFLELGSILASDCRLNAVPLAGACDHLMLTCRLGATKRSSLRRTIERLRVANCVVGGVILDQSSYSPAGEGLARAASWLVWPFPRLRRRFETRALSNDLS